MPDFKSTFTDEVRRVAKKEAKALNEIITAQGKTIKALTKRVAELEKKAGAVAPVVEKVEPTDVLIPAKTRKARFSPKTIAKLRKKYGISQKALASILGVTQFTVSHWEIGKNRPFDKQVAAISALVKLPKRKFYALLAEKAPEEFATIKAKKDKKAAKKPAKIAKPAKATKPAKKAKAPKATKTVAVPAPAVVTDKVITVKT
jgi:DNA-binding transcriptional regulator YiaG